MSCLTANKSLRQHSVAPLQTSKKATDTDQQNFVYPGSPSSFHFYEKETHFFVTIYLLP